MTTLRTRLVGLAATVATLALVAGFPALLIAIDATPVPTSVPSWDTVVTALTSRDDGTLTLRVLAVVAWGGWAFLTFTIALDVWARLRRLRAPTLPGLALPQSAAHTLVGAAVLLFAAAPTLAPTTPAAAAPPPAATAQPWHATADPVAGQHSPTATPHAALRKTAPTSPLRAATTRHTVVAGESLWSIARDHLGDATRYAQIAALNAHVLNGDPDLIHPGTILTLPPVPAPGTPTGTRAVGYTVQRGDTLSGIAHDSPGRRGSLPRDLRRVARHHPARRGPPGRPRRHRRRLDADHPHPRYRRRRPGDTGVPGRTRARPRPATPPDHAAAAGR